MYPFQYLCGRALTPNTPSVVLLLALTTTMVSGELVRFNLKKTRSMMGDLLAAENYDMIDMLTSGTVEQAAAG